MVIDCHTHIFEAGRGGPFDLPASAEDLLREMDKHGVDASIVLPLPGVASNKFAHEECARYPDRLMALYTPEFDVLGETMHRMEVFFEQYSPKGLKIHPRRQAITIHESIVIEVLAWADAAHLPVLFDVFPFGPTLAKSATHPLAYHELAQRMPRLQMILAHAGGYRMMEAFLAAKANSGIYLDLSFTPVYFKGSSLAEDCSFLCNRLPPGRVLYGSDFPYVRYSDSLAAAHHFSADLTEDLRREVMGEAAARLFGIESD
jgi:predicted TIM-barrel fold metal-dependent hydrolase